MATIEEIAESIINEAQEKANEISKEYTLKTKEALKTIQNEHKKRLRLQPLLYLAIKRAVCALRCFDCRW